MKPTPCKMSLAALAIYAVAIVIGLLALVLARLQARRSRFWVPRGAQQSTLSPGRGTRLVGRSDKLLRQGALDTNNLLSTDAVTPIVIL
jgi:hypothetical protein